MRIRVLSLFAAVLLVAACETAPEETGATAGEGAAPLTTAAPSAPVTAAVEPEAVGVAPAEPALTPGTQADLVVNVGDRVFFDFDKAVLKPEAQNTLRRQAAWLASFPDVTVTIEGHCDERGTREYNLALGERRANAVKNFLVALGIDASRLATISYGKERPAVVGSNEAAWAQNRRGMTIVD
ncbi:MAG: peptidoglycan-associated lipoprotein Pal [Alphaproteobacteria bacterium]